MQRAVLLSLRRIAFALLLLGAGTGAHLAHRELGEREAASDAILPDPASLRFLAGNHRTSVADLYWLHLVQYVGRTAKDPEPWPLLEALADLVTTVDPEYGYAYEASGVLLSEAGRFEASNRILRKGTIEAPNRWQLPFFASFNHWHHLGEFEAGAELLLRAARIPGSPHYLAELSSRLYASAGNVDEGLALVEMMMQVADSPMMLNELERQRDQLLVERALQRVEAAVRRFFQEEKRLPSTLHELRTEGIPELLRTEIGASLQWDRDSGTVASPLLPERLHLYRPPVDGVPEALARPPEP